MTSFVIRLCSPYTEHLVIPLKSNCKQALILSYSSILREQLGFLSVKILADVWNVERKTGYEPAETKSKTQAAFSSISQGRAE